MEYKCYLIEEKGKAVLRSSVILPLPLQFYKKLLQWLLMAMTYHIASPQEVVSIVLRGKVPDFLFAEEGFFPAMTNLQILDELDDMVEFGWLRKVVRKLDFSVESVVQFNEMLKSAAPIFGLESRFAYPIPCYTEDDKCKWGNQVVSE